MQFPVPPVVLVLVGPRAAKGIGASVTPLRWFSFLWFSSPEFCSSWGVSAEGRKYLLWIFFSA